MRLYLKNIGKLKEADIKLEGITVVAGENNSGKSTVGKALYATLSSLNQLEEKKKMTISNTIANIISVRLYSASDFHLYFKDFCLNEDTITLKKIMDWIDANTRFKNCISGERNQLLREKISKVCDISSEELNHKVATFNFIQEFAQNTRNIFATNNDEAFIRFHFGSKRIVFSVTENSSILSQGLESVDKSVIYLDSPDILEELSLRKNFPENHQQHLISNLTKTTTPELAEQILFERSILKLINSVCEGELIFQSTVSYSLKKIGRSLDVKNLSTGLKSFAILKTLILNGSLSRGSVLILDEPEIHLHPEWQLVYAELIVLLQKEFNLTVLLTTHSPYFLRALEVYAEVHKVADKCNYYFAKNEGQEAMIYDATEDIEQIYKKLADPFQILENLRWQDEP